MVARWVWRESAAEGLLKQKAFVIVGDLLGRLMMLLLLLWPAGVVTVVDTEPARLLLLLLLMREG